jgi:hypothetical protein
MRPRFREMERNGCLVVHDNIIDSDPRGIPPRETDRCFGVRTDHAYAPNERLDATDIRFKPQAGRIDLV